MKKLITITSFLLFISIGYAQDATEVKIDSMLVNIDKSTLTSGILYERVYPWAALTTFNESAENVSSVKHFEQALHELYRASNEQKFANYKEFRKKNVSKKQEHKVDIGILNASFQKLNYNQEDESMGGLRLEENKFEQIEGKSPFLDSHTFIVAPLKDYLRGTMITYNFDSSFLFDVASTKKLTSLTVNFGNKRTYLVYKEGVFVNKSIQIRYTETGYKTLISTAVFADGTQITTKGKLHVKLPNLTTMSTDNGTEDGVHVNTTLPFQGYDESAPIYGELEYRIFYHKDATGNYERTLLKPIVIIDGFDPGDERKISDADSTLPDEDHNSIEEMMIYTNENNDPVDIINELRKPENGGYDVIIVNHPTYTRGTKTIDGGADYIERNGLNHASFYQFLNSEIFANGSSEKLVVVGPSMGGQISRYALAYMEKNNIPHNTRLWVSIDSPHLGANIPIGSQTLLNMVAFTGNVGAINFVEGFLGSVAAKQQLIEQYRGTFPTLYNGAFYLTLKQDYLNARTINQGYSETRGHPFFTRFYDNLYGNGISNSKGYS